MMKRIFAVLLALALLCMLLPQTILLASADEPETLTVGNKISEFIYLLWWMKNCPEPTITEVTYEDISESDPFYTAALWAYETRVYKGADPMHFQPEKTVLRGEAVFYLRKAYGNTAPAATVLPYLDVGESDWYYQAILWASDKDWITLNAQPDAFFPNQPVDKLAATRSENGVTFVLGLDKSQTCGENLTWSFDEETGTLTITGSGAMEDYNQQYAPWDGFKTKIKAISMPEGLTRIGSNAFYGCEALMELAIPDGVTDLGNNTFARCSALERVSIPGSVSETG